MFGSTKSAGVRRQIMLKTAWALLGLAIVSCSLATCLRAPQQMPPQQPYQRLTPFAARRAADDSRPLMRISSQPQQQRQSLSSAESAEAPIIVGRFKTPGPGAMTRLRVPSGADFGTQTVGASFRVSELDENNDERPERVVQGVNGASASNRVGVAASRPQLGKPKTVGAKIQVSDEGLNYPPSKLSADIYGNVAEIVTAPPEAVDSDFLIPASNRFFSGNQNQPRP